MTPTTTRSRLEHRIGSDGLCSIRVRHGDVRLRAVDGETMVVRERHDRDLEGMFDITLGDGSVSIGESLGNRRSGGSPDVEIDLPRRATVVVETSSGDLEVDGLTGDQRYRTASGYLRFRGVGGTLSIEVHSGDVDVAATAEADLNLRSLSGDVELRAGTLRSLRVNTTSGDLKAAGRLLGPGPFSIESVSGDVLLAPAGDVRVELTTLSGDLRSDVGGVIEHGRGRQSVAIGSGGPLLSIRSTSGDVTVVRAVPVSEPREAEVTPGEAAAAPANGAIAAAYDDARMRILRSLERGEIDVAEATRRLEALDAGPGADAADDAGQGDPGTDADTDTVAWSADDARA
jgi:hypothetical protein